jgi:hypothetical protein
MGRASCGLTDSPSIDNSDRIKPVEGTMTYARDLAIDVAPYSVAVIEIIAK